ncbi:oxygen-insensitive NADPH nitroreductase [Salirhabdus salicampi]|uniref:oxygen-insensitive NADPH nitroreductase n=1 Tax=Salirhabdus salicampi TaxID=476102 RepID=UPI0020C5ACDB|nr:oxygen-insensitive NADPH nitroreductase [Salirhabdus salicampi]MCP8615656.1 oxygen-insensitive NADPH nitroreductase [Salirhabdus salicampi]
MKSVKKHTVELLQNHRSIRRFSNKKIPYDDIKNIILSAQAASSSSHGQSYSIINVTDVKKRKLLSEYAGNQEQVVSSSHFFVFCADLNRLEQLSNIEEVDLTESLDSTEMFIIATVDASLAAQNAAIAAEALGLGIVYTGGIRNHPEEVSALLNLPNRVYPIFGMCFGYYDKKQTPELKPRLPIDAVFFENEYKPFSETFPYIQEYDSIMEHYYRNRTSNARNDNWTKVMTNKRKVPRRMNMKSFLEKQGFPFK